MSGRFHAKAGHLCHAGTTEEYPHANSAVRPRKGCVCNTKRDVLLFCTAILLFRRGEESRDGMGLPSKKSLLKLSRLALQARRRPRGGNFVRGRAAGAKGPCPQLLACLVLSGFKQPSVPRSRHILSAWVECSAAAPTPSILTARSTSTTLTSTGPSGRALSARYVLGRVLACPSLSYAHRQVRVVEHKRTKQLYALKYIDKAKCIKQKAVANIIQERRLLEEVCTAPLLNR